MARQTSIDVYRKIEADGLLSRLRWEVYSWLFHNGPATSFEVANGIHAEHKSVSPRMVELVARSVVCEVGKKVCTASPQRHTAIAWDVTAHLPVEPPQVKVYTLTITVDPDVDRGIDEDLVERLVGDGYINHDVSARRRPAIQLEAELIERRN